MFVQGSIRPLLVIAAIACGFLASPCQAEVDWQPAKTRVFAVGVLEWQHPDIWPGFPSAQVHRRDAELIEHFKTAGVAPDRIVYLQDKQATRSRIQTALQSLLANTQPDELLVFYFAGHGFRDHKSHAVHFANYDAKDGATAWPVRAIYDTLEAHFRGSHVLLMADCCFSGGLVDEAKNRKSPLGYACICSAHSHNSSTGRWTFTETLLAGFRGHPTVDLNDDGEIDLSELGQYSELEMAFLERQKGVYDANHNFPTRWRVARPSQHKTPREGERVEIEWQRKWYRGEILTSAGDKCRVHYAGFADSWDEWVTPERLRPFRPRHFDKGTAVEIWSASDKKWYPGTVLRSWYGLAFVHYDGWSKEWNEWVNFDSLRLPGQAK